MLCESGTGTLERQANQRNPQVVQRISPIVAWPLSTVVLSCLTDT